MPVSSFRYELFGKYGAIRQIRVGVTPETRGTAFVVYEDIFDAKNAVDHLSGFNMSNRYLIVLYFNKEKMDKRRNQLQSKKDEILKMKEQLDKMEDKWSPKSSTKY